MRHVRTLVRAIQQRDRAHTQHAHQILIRDVACDKCRTYIFVGANLMSCWRQESKDIWQANYDSLKGYEFIEITSDIS